MADGHTQQELVRLVAKRGYRVSDVQFARWHREGLLPAPDRQWLGKKHGSGKFIYPAEAADRLLRICELRQEKRTRRHDLLAWYLWWERCHVPMATVRGFLEEVARRVDSGADALRTKSPDELQPAVEAGYSEDVRLAPSEALASRARRRVGKGGLPSFMASLLAPPVSDGTSSGLVEGLGLQFLFGVLLGQKALGSGDVVEVSEVARSVLSGCYSERLAALADDDLCRCRDHVQQVLVEVGQIGFVARQAGGKSAESLFAALQPSDAVDQARWLLVLEPLFDDPAFRGPRPVPGTRTVLDLAPLIGILEQLMAEVPEIVEDETLTPARLKSTLHDADQFKRLLVAVQMFAREDPERVGGFLVTHPEARALLFPDGLPGDST
jgi:hypothetical protein